MKANRQLLWVLVTMMLLNDTETDSDLYIILLVILAVYCVSYLYYIITE